MLALSVLSLTLVASGLRAQTIPGANPVDPAAVQAL